MHRDKKLGLALGVLLVGIVAAMFFRLDPGKRDSLPRLKSSQALDEQIAELPLGPYPDDEAWDDTDGSQTAKKLVEPPLWEMPDFLADDLDEPSADWLASTPATPDPIRQRNDDTEMFDGETYNGTPVPRHNQAWTVSDTKIRNPQPGQSQSVRIHRVRNGDTLSGIAAYYLGSSARFNEIYVLNREVLANPNTLTVGTELRIPASVEPKRAANESDSVFRNADGQDVIEPAEKSNGGPTFPASPSSHRARAGDVPTTNVIPSRRFTPARRLPFAPRNRDGKNPQEGSQQPANKSLSQIPPLDLPEID